MKDLKPPVIDPWLVSTSRQQHVRNRHFLYLCFKVGDSDAVNAQSARSIP